MSNGEGVCGGNVIIIGHRIEPRHLVGYGTIEETCEDFDLEREKVVECYKYMGEI